MARPFRLLDLRAGEGPAFFRAFSLIALLIAGHTLLETARDALFLQRLPPAFLTLVYVIVALGALIVSPLSTRLVSFSGARNALVATLLLSAYGAMWFRYQHPSEAVVLALYVFGALSATTLVAEFWLLAQIEFTAAQGRRLFAPLSAGGVLGAVAGAGLASLLLMRFDVRTLLVLAAVAYLLAAFVATGIAGEDDRPAAPVVASPARAAITLKEPFVLKLAAVAAVSTALSVLIDYVFKARVWSSYHGAELGPFFAHYQLLLNVGSLILQVFLTSRLVERVGVLGLVTLSPALLFLGSSVTASARAAVSLVVMLKSADTVLKNSVGRVGMELLWAPVNGRERARGFVDGIVVRAAQALAALLLLPLTFSHDVSLSALTWTAAGLAFIWLSLSVRVRAPYIELFRRALGQGAFERDMAPEIDLTAAETLVEALARPEPRDVIAAMNLLADRGRGRLIPALMLYHSDESVLLRALELFGAEKRNDWFALGERLFTHPSEVVRAAAVRALALGGAREALERARNQPDPTVAALAAIHLAQLDGRRVANDGKLSELISGRENEDMRFRVALIDALVANPSPESPQLLLSLAEDPALRSAVTEALVRMNDEETIPFLITRLASRDDRVNARQALLRRGPPAFAALKAVMSDPQADRRVRLHVPQTLAAFANGEAVTALLEVLRTESGDGFLRYKALQALEQLARRTALPIDLEPVIAELGRNCREYLRLFSLAVPLRADPSSRERTSRALTLGLVEDKLNQSLERIARLCQVAQRTDDIHAVFEALRSEDRHERARAVEFLDAIARGWERRSSSETAQLLRLVVDDLAPEERVLAAAPLVGRVASVTEALSRLAQDSDPIMAEIALHAQRLAEASRPRSVPPPPPMTPIAELA
jgi:AAA family ATP:ADP antiporter